MTADPFDAAAPGAPLRQERALSLVLKVVAPALPPRV